MSEILDWEREKVKFGNMNKPQEYKLVFIWTQITWFSTTLEELIAENKVFNFDRELLSTTKSF